MARFICLGLVVLSVMMSAGQANFVLATEDDNQEGQGDKVVFLATKLRTSSSFKVRLKAAVLLGRLQDERAVTYLVDALEDANYVVRGAACRALGNLGVSRSSSAVDGIFARLKDEERFVRKEAKLALTKLAGDETLPKFEAMSEHTDPSVRLAAVEVISLVRSEKAYSLLARAMGDEVTEVAQRARQALLNMDPEARQPILIKALADKRHFRAQRQAVRMAGEIGLVAALEPLANLVVSDQVVPEVRGEAARALAKMKSKLDAGKLIEQVQSGDRSAQYRAIPLLGIIGSTQAVDALLGLLRHGDTYIRQRAVFALGDAGDARAIPVLKKLHTNVQDGRFRKRIARVIRKLEHPSDTRTP